MSRKDYIAVAAVLHTANVSRQQRLELAARFAELFARDNVRFRVDLFLQAATGVTDA